MNRTEAETLRWSRRIVADNDPQRADRGNPELRSRQRHFWQFRPEPADYAADRRRDESREHDRDRHGRADSEWHGDTKAVRRSGPPAAKSIIRT